MVVDAGPENQGPVGPRETWTTGGMENAANGRSAWARWIDVSRCLSSITGAEQVCAIRSYLATAAKHGTSALDALIRAAEGQPWLPDTT